MRFLSLALHVLPHEEGTFYLSDRQASIPVSGSFLLCVWCDPLVEFLASNADTFPGFHCWEAFFVNRCLDCPAAYTQPFAYGGDAVVVVWVERLTRIIWKFLACHAPAFSASSARRTSSDALMLST